ncbi:hypothetical protein BSL78_04046 [Apostichopus japonicus]|uniref:phosphoethanolamine N-methyltransferase n=1 Tax=Stichopus japonicus TaxID=307972 RepID=A0A2G8LFI9_STIJA|nr:hypothetical protein BSL78_04046 [Apostichopus japonicus]
MTKFWESHSHNASIEEMMLDTNASLISQEELPEVMALLPELKGKNVLELGGGIGRFTSQIATQSSHVTTVDFMESFIQKNRDLNKDHNNIEFITADVTKLEMEKGRQRKRQFNPSKYRSPELYNNLFQSVSVPGTGKTPWGFDVCFSQSLQSYIKLKNNRNQICWLMEKTPRSDEGNHGFVTFQQFLDNKQYSKRGILRYEKIFGAGYVSTGGPQTTEDYKVDVLGVDLSGNMIEMAWERSQDEINLPVQFEVADITKREYPLESFDVVYSRDTILHIADKLTLFKRFLTWLKPGGKLLISDYCCGEPPHSEEFKAYVKQRGYTLYTPKEYGKLIEEAGFIKVKAEDRSQQFINVLNGEKNKINSNKQEFLKDFTDEDFKYLEEAGTVNSSESATRIRPGVYFMQKNKIENFERLFVNGELFGIWTS